MGESCRQYRRRRRMRVLRTWGGRILRTAAFVVLVGGTVILLAKR